MSNRPSFYNTVRWRLEFYGTCLSFFFIRLFPMAFTVPVFQAVVRTLGQKLKPNQRIQNNLNRVYGNTLTDEKKKAITQGVWNNFANVGLDFVYLPLLRKTIKTRPENFIIEGQDILDDIQARRQGAIFFSAHSATWEIIRLVAFERGIKMAMMYRAFNNPLIDKIAQDLLTQGTDETPFFHKGVQGTRHLMKWLKSEQSLLILVDQKLTEGKSIPFMGVPAKTATAPAELALKLNKPFIPVVVQRQGIGKFKIIFQPPLDLEKARNSDNPVLTVCQEMNTAVESWVYQRPEEWFWLHRRWG